MIPAAFTYHRPTSVKEAVGLLAQFGEEGRALAGGHSLIPMMKLRLAAPEHLVDLAGVSELKGIRTDGGDIVIGGDDNAAGPGIPSSRSSDGHH